MNEHIVVQNSTYWNSWRASKNYSLQINIYSAKIECDPSCTVKSSQIDPYIVCFLARDRSQSKKKTTVLKKTIEPVWNECVLFSGVDIHDKFVCELKMPAWGPLNPVLATYSFELEELMKLSQDELKCKAFRFVAATQGISADVFLGFVLDAPVSTLQVPSGEDLTPEQVFDDDVTGETPVFLNTQGAFASFLFFANCHPVETEDGQVVPFDNKLKTRPSDVVAL